MIRETVILNENNKSRINGGSGITIINNIAMIKNAEPKLTLLNCLIVRILLNITYSPVSIQCIGGQTGLTYLIFRNETLLELLNPVHIPAYYLNPFGNVLIEQYKTKRWQQPYINLDVYNHQPPQYNR